MGEEGKKKKLVYEQPRLVKLSGAAGEGQCENGSGDEDCFAGNTAGEGCYAGDAAGTFCSTGSEGASG